MDLLFLGTSSGTPTKARNVSGTAVIETASSAWHLVDCGEGTQHRLLHTPLSLNDLQAIFKRAARQTFPISPDSSQSIFWDAS